MLCAIALSSFIVIRASDWTLIVNSFVQLNSFCVNSCYVWNVFIMPGTDSTILLGSKQDADRWRALITVLIVRTNIALQPTIIALSEKYRGSIEPSFQVYFLLKPIKTFTTMLKRLHELTFHQQPFNVSILILSKHIIKGISFLQIICITLDISPQLYVK